MREQSLTAARTRYGDAHTLVGRLRRQAHVSERSLHQPCHSPVFLYGSGERLGSLGALASPTCWKAHRRAIRRDWCGAARPAWPWPSTSCDRCRCRATAARPDHRRPTSTLHYSITCYFDCLGQRARLADGAMTGHVGGTCQVTRTARAGAARPARPPPSTHHVCRAQRRTLCTYKPL